MDLGLNFDDEDLLCQCNERNKVGDRDVPYNVKICTSQWFEDALEGLDENGEEANDDLRMKMEKFSADHHYHQKDYITAAAKYKRLSDMMTPKSNSALWHDVQESLSRCYIYTGLRDQGLHIAREMVKSSLTEDEARQRQALSLLSFACEKVQNWAECVDTLEQLCELQPQYPQVWVKLGDIYSHFQKECELSTDDLDSLLIKQLSSYLRAKLLFQSVMGTASDFLKDRNIAIIQQLTDKIDQVPISPSKKKFASEFIQKEIENQATISGGAFHKGMDNPSNKRLKSKNHQKSLFGSKDSLSETPNLSVKDTFGGYEYEKGTFVEKFCCWNNYYDR